LLGGRYSSGIWTFGRLGAGVAAAPSTKSREVSSRLLDQRYGAPSAASLFARNFCFSGFVYLVVSVHKNQNATVYKE
jgi:hypothetical protein